MINTELLKKFAEKIDSLIDFSKIIKNKIAGTVVEMSDGPVLKWSFIALNDQFGDRIPEKFLDDIEMAIQCFIDGDYIGALLTIPEGLADAFDLEQLDQETEAAWFKANFKAAIDFAMFYAAKKAGEEKGQLDS